MSIFGQIMRFRRNYAVERKKEEPKIQIGDGTEEE